MAGYVEVFPFLYPFLFSAYVLLIIVSDDRNETLGQEQMKRSGIRTNAGTYVVRTVT